MLKRNLLIGLCAGAMSAFGQSIASVNFRYLYDPQNDINFPMKVVNEKNQMTVYYRLSLNNPQDAMRNYSISWEKRDSFIQREGTRVRPEDSVSAVGRLSFPVPEKPWLLVAKITSTDNKHWLYYQMIEAKYPVNGYIEDDDGMVFTTYVKADREYTFRGVQKDKPLHIFIYKTDFPPAAPPFADRDGSVDRFLFSDSTFQVPNGAKVRLKSKGLYLVQQDTLAAEGFAFRVVGPSFPKHNKVEDIPPPLIFVSTKEEHDEMMAAKGDKSKVDKVILDITQSTDRAKTFMRSYFRKVELDNIYFTSYKEGWKTDPGMLYLVYGLPTEVSRTGQNETWYYKDNNERLTFLKTGSIYDPQHYVLLRNRRFTENWFKSIDNWRKSRF